MVIGGGSSTIRTIATVATVRDQATGTLDDAEEAGDRAAESMEETEQSARNLGRQFAVLGGATTALVGTLGMLVRQHGETEQTFARMRTVTGATTEEMEELRSTAIQLGTDLPVSVSQSASALEQLAFAGFEAEEAISAAHGVANLAAASSMQVDEAARAAASAVRMFGMEAEDTTQVTASMAAIFSESTTSIRELNSVIERAGPAADAAGVSFNQLAAAAGVMADNGIRASKAGTALENTIRRIATGSGQAEEALEELGLSIDDLTDEEGGLNDLAGTIQTIGAEVQDIEDRYEQLAVATELAGERGARALLPLLRNSEDLQEKLGAQFRSEVRASIGELARLTDDELEGVEQALEMDVDADDITPHQVLQRLEHFADEGESVEEVAVRMQAALNISSEAAEQFATALVTGEASAEELAEGIGDATTASELAAEQMDTTAGSVEFLRSSISAFTFAVHSGASPAIKSFNQLLASGIGVVNEHEEVGAALGATMVGVTGVLGAATLALGAHIAQLKVASAVQSMHTSQTIAGTAALKAKAAATTAASKAQLLMTMSTGQLIAATSTKTTALWASVTGLAASAKASIAAASAKGLLTTATGGLTAAVLALNAALGPIGAAFLLVGAATAALVAIWRTDLFGAGERAGSILGFVGNKAQTGGAAVREFVGILYELGRIGATLGGMALLAPFAAVLRIPDLIKGVPADARAAAAGIPSAIISGLGRLGPAKYAMPVLGPILLARDMIADPERWLEAGRSIPSMIASGIRQRASEPVDAVSNIADDAREYLPFSPAARGAFTDLDDVGPSFVRTIASGVEREESTLTSTVSTIAERSMQAVSQTAPGRTAMGMAQAITPAGQQADQLRRAAGGAGRTEVNLGPIDVGPIHIDGGEDETTVEQAREAGQAAGEEAVKKMLRDLQRIFNYDPEAAANF